MAQIFQVRLETAADGVGILHVAFGPQPAENHSIVREAVAEIRALGLPGGRGIKVYGPASLPVAFALCHEIAHKYGFVAVWDPKLSQYSLPSLMTPQSLLARFSRRDPL